METQKDRSLRRRIQSLQIFLFEQLHRELLQVQSETNPPPAASDAASTASIPSAKVAQTLLKHASASLGKLATADMAEPSLPSPGDASEQSAAEVDPSQADAAQPEAQDGKTVIDQTFGLMVRQRTRCLAQHKAEKHREFRSFQVCVCIAVTIQIHTLAQFLHGLEEVASFKPSGWVCFSDRPSRKEKDYTLWCQFNEKPSCISGCPVNRQICKPVWDPPQAQCEGTGC